MEVLRTENLTKAFKYNTVVNNINMTIKKGQIYGLVGRNGAGKTTLMKMILGMVKPSGGEIYLWGKETQKEKTIAASGIGALLDSQGFYPELTAEENLKVFTSIKGVTRKNTIAKTLEIVGLSEEINKKYKHFSLGMKKRLGLANAIIHEPHFLILDEPTNGLDPLGIVDFREYVMMISQRYHITVLISSHQLSEISAMSDKVGILEKGQLLAEKSIEEISMVGRKTLRLTVTDVNLTSSILESEFQCHDFKVIDKETVMIFNVSINRTYLAQELMKKSVAIINTEVIQNDLESYFTHLIDSHPIEEKLR